MSGLATASLIASALSTVVYGGTLLWLAPRHERSLLMLIAAMAVPLAPLAYHAVRVPIETMAGGPPGGAVWLRAVLPPLIEEPAKLLPVLLPVVARAIGRENAWRFGISLGLGFGLGEIALLVQLLEPVQAVAAAPWTSLTGFISERYIVCLTHGAFTAAALVAWRSAGKPFWAGLLAAIALHFVANLPVALASLFIADLPTRSAVLAIWLLLVWSVAIVGLVALARAGGRGTKA
jgi:RsiW-degrading membrane proteinase PrsW (M82 family)